MVNEEETKDDGKFFRWKCAKAPFDRSYFERFANGILSEVVTSISKKGIFNLLSSYSPKPPPSVDPPSTRCRH